MNEQPATQNPDHNEKTPGADTAERIGGIIPAVLFAVFMYYLVVWKNLDAITNTKWVITGIAAGLLLFSAIVAKSRTSRLFEYTRNFLIILAMTSGAGLVAIGLATRDRTIIFKLFVIAYFSLLPAWLYLQFIATKGKTIWEEYVINLFRLRVDADRHLPMPPQRSLFFPRWQTANPEGPSTENLYQKKFEACSDVPRGEHREHLSRRRRNAPDLAGVGDRRGAGHRVRALHLPRHRW
jgi:hypothetical protein